MIDLSSPLSLKNARIKNRLMKSAMSEQLGTRDHSPRPGLNTLYRAWAQGGIGLCVTGNVMIDRTALGEPGNVVLDSKSDLTLFREWAEAGSANDTQLWMQLNHPGKQVARVLSREPVAPSAVPLSGGLEKVFNPPRALTEAEIYGIIEKFALAAGLARQAGFQGVQIHGAHGYLVSQFLSPRHNIRTDEWGGTEEKRSRFAAEVYRAMRNAVGKDFPIGIKLNSADFQRGGFTEEASMRVLQMLESEGIDLIEISGGNYESPAMTGARRSTIEREAYFLEYAQKARELVKTPMTVTGGFRTAKAMREALRSGATDLIGLARPLAVDPEFPRKILDGTIDGIDVQNPTTGSAFLDRMSIISITWYEHQLARIAAGQAPNPRMSGIRSVLATALSMGWKSFVRTRA